MGVARRAEGRCSQSGTWAARARRPGGRARRPGRRWSARARVPDRRRRRRAGTGAGGLGPTRRSSGAPCTSAGTCWPMRRTRCGRSHGRLRRHGPRRDRGRGGAPRRRAFLRKVAPALSRRWQRAWKRRAVACSTSSGCPRPNGSRRGPPTPSSACTRSSSAASRPGRCCRRRKRPPGCPRRCSPPARSRCARSTAGGIGPEARRRRPGSPRRLKAANLAPPETINKANPTRSATAQAGAAEQGDP